MRSVALALALSGCTLDLNGKDRCTLPSDCRPGLVCNESGLCEAPGVGLSLGEFESDPALHLITPRDKLSASRVGDWLYVIGGRTGDPGKPEEFVDKTLERARILPDGALSGFEPVGVTLKHARSRHASVVVSGRLCVLGGTDDPGGLVECARIGANGDLDGFEDLPGVSLDSAHSYFGAVVIDPYVYVLGGYLGPDALESYADTVERARIGPQGLSGSFEHTGRLLDASAYVTAVVIDGFLYAIGDGVNVDIWSVDRAAISLNGDVGDFSRVSGIPYPTVHHRPMGLRVGRSVYLLGGQETVNQTTPYFDEVAEATVGEHGTLETFSDVGSLQAQRNSGVAIRLGSFVYVIGGQVAFPPDAGYRFNFGRPVDSVEFARLR